MTILRMSIAYWIVKARHSYSEYVILLAFSLSEYVILVVIDFPLQDWLHDRASVLC
jgi:hypothetical protein